jgi:hypothetical protein
MQNVRCAASIPHVTSCHVAPRLLPLAGLPPGRTAVLLSDIDLPRFRQPATLRRSDHHRSATSLLLLGAQKGHAIGTLINNTLLDGTKFHEVIVIGGRVVPTAFTGAIDMTENDQRSAGTRTPHRHNKSVAKDGILDVRIE